MKDASTSRPRNSFVNRSLSGTVPVGRDKGTGDRVFKVRNGQQRLTFEGVLLSESSSRRKNNPRWVEFELYKTNGGVYILSRIGQSNVFHSPICEVLDRGDGLDPAPVDRDATPCEICEPHWQDDLTFPENPRFWAGLIETPTGVLDSLYRFDDNGSRYLTRVARDLVEDAAAKDPALADAYYEEHVY